MLQEKMEPVSCLDKKIPGGELPMMKEEVITEDDFLGNGEDTEFEESEDKLSMMKEEVKAPDTPSSDQLPRGTSKRGAAKASTRTRRQRARQRSVPPMTCPQAQLQQQLDQTRHQLAQTQRQLAYCSQQWPPGMFNPGGPRFPFPPYFLGHRQPPPMFGQNQGNFPTMNSMPISRPGPMFRGPPIRAGLQPGPHQSAGGPRFPFPPYFLGHRQPPPMIGQNQGNFPTMNSMPISQPGPMIRGPPIRAGLQPGPHQSGMYNATASMHGPMPPQGMSSQASQMYNIVGGSTMGGQNLGIFLPMNAMPISRPAHMITGPPIKDDGLLPIPVTSISGQMMSQGPSSNGPGGAGGPALMAQGYQQGYQNPNPMLNLRKPLPQPYSTVRLTPNESVSYYIKPKESLEQSDESMTSCLSKQESTPQVQIEKIITEHDLWGNGEDFEFEASEDEDSLTEERKLNTSARYNKFSSRKEERKTASYYIKPKESHEHSVESMSSCLSKQESTPQVEVEEIITEFEESEVKLPMMMEELKAPDTPLLDTNSADQSASGTSDYDLNEAKYIILRDHYQAKAKLLAEASMRNLSARGTSELKETKKKKRKLRHRDRFTIVYENSNCPGGTGGPALMAQGYQQGYQNPNPMLNLRKPLPQPSSIVQVTPNLEVFYYTKPKESHEQSDVSMSSCLSKQESTPHVEVEEIITGDDFLRNGEDAEFEESEDKQGCQHSNPLLNLRKPSPQPYNIVETTRRKTVTYYIKPKESHEQSDESMTSCLSKQESTPQVQIEEIITEHDLWGNREDSEIEASEDEAKESHEQSDESMTSCLSKQESTPQVEVEEVITEFEESEEKVSMMTEELKAKHTPLPDTNSDQSAGGTSKRKRTKKNNYIKMLSRSQMRAAKRNYSNPMLNLRKHVPQPYSFVESTPKETVFYYTKPKKSHEQSVKSMSSCLSKQESTPQVKVEEVITEVDCFGNGEDAEFKEPEDKPKKSHEQSVKSMSSCLSKQESTPQVKVEEVITEVDCFGNGEDAEFKEPEDKGPNSNANMSMMNDTQDYATCPSFRGMGEFAAYSLVGKRKMMGGERW